MIKKLPFLGFISISLIRQPNISQRYDIHNYWVDYKSETFGYTDTNGNILEFKDGINNTTTLFPCVKHLHNFQKNKHDYIINQYSEKFEKSRLITKQDEKQFRWKDTTLSETFFESTYYRSNYYGSTYIHNFTNNNVEVLELEKKSNESYYQGQNWIDGVSISVNDGNILCIHKYKNSSMKQVFQQKIIENTILKKIKVFPVGDLYHILLHYKNDKIYLLSIKHVHKIENYQMVGLHKITDKKNVIDCDFQYPFLVIMTLNQLEIYEVKSNVLIKKITTKNIPDLPYFTSMLFYKNWILFNGQSNILSFVYVV